MMYSNNCVLAVLVNGIPCNELANGSVQIPFNSEYIIRVRNKDKKRRVVAKVFVDRENVAEGGIIVNPNSYVDLEGPIDLHKRFKFVSLDSSDAVDFGKNGSNPDKSKGLIEARFHFEKEVKTAEEHHHHHHYHNWPMRPVRPIWHQPYNPYRKDHHNRIPSLGPWSSNEFVPSTFNDNLAAVAKPLRSAISCSVNIPLQDGCTVEGSYTGQSFNTMNLDYEPEATVLKIFLQGFDLDCVAMPKPVFKSSPLRRKNPESEVSIANCEDAELKTLREKKLELQKELERLEVEVLKKKLEQLKTDS